LIFSHYCVLPIYSSRNVLCLCSFYVKTLFCLFLRCLKCDNCRLQNAINLILIIGSVCLCHCERLSVPCYFLAPCDNCKHTAHADQQAASQASTDSAWRHPVWLLHSSLGCRSYRLTPQATITRIVIVACNNNNN